jgi:RimJ/RimL family protein N-acetyltransferase
MPIYQKEQIILKDGADLFLRSLGAHDLEKYLLFSKKIASETTHTLHCADHRVPSDLLKEKWENAAISPWQLELGGFVEARLISHLSLYKPRPNHPYEKHVLEFGLVILKEYCCKGLGSKKMQIMEEVASKMHVKRIQAKVRTSNFKAILFYQKQGYEIEGIKKHAVYINGKYEDEFCIAKILG